MWCRPIDIGKSATLGTVHEVETAFYNQKLIFYEPEQTIYRYNVNYLLQGNDEWKFDLDLPVIDLKTVRGYVGRGLLYNDLEVVRVDRNRYAVVRAPFLPPSNLELVLTPGLAVLTDLDGSETLAQGDSVIRNGLEMIIDWVDREADPLVPDYTWKSGDQLASPPPTLRELAIEIGGALLEMGDDVKRKLERGPTLFDGYADVLRGLYEQR